MKLATAVRIQSSSGLFRPSSVGAGSLKLWLRSDLGISINDVGQPPANMSAFTDIRRATVSQSGTDPFGGASSYFIKEDNTAGNTHGVVFAPPGYAGGTTATFTVYAKASTRTWFWLGDAAPGNAGSTFDLTNGVVGTTAGGATATIFSAGAGWYKCSVTGIFANNAWSGFMATGSAPATTSYAGDNVSGLFLSTPSVTQPKVSAWGDQSGAGNHLAQSTGTAQPLLVNGIYNGKAAVRLASANSQTLLRANTNLFGSGAYSMYLVVKIGSSVLNTGLFSCDAASAGNALYLDGALMSVLHSGAAAHDGTSFDSTALHIWGARRAAGAAPTLDIDATTQTLSNSGSTTLIDPGGSAILALGKAVATANFADMDVCEAIAYSSQLSTADHLRVRHYLGQRYGIAA